jgi:hypothetical protein
MNTKVFLPRHLAGRIFALVFLCLIVTAGPVMAESQFAEGFRGIPWGTHKDQLPDLGLKPGALANIYKTGPSSAFLMSGAGKLAMEFDTVPLLTIFLNFFDQRLYGADLIFDPQHREHIYAILAKDLGMQGLRTERGHQWQTENLNITLNEREVIIVSEIHNPEKSSLVLPPTDKDAPCCQGKG